MRGDELMAKRIACVVLALVLCVSSVISLAACSSLPDISRVKDRFIYLIEGSKDLNVIFFGVGLPTFAREGAISERLGIYYENKLMSYNTVEIHSPFMSVSDIKAEAERIFSKDYLDLIYESAFEGVVGQGSTYLRFYELEGEIYQSINATDFGLSERIYDYSTMKVVKPSNNEYINITVESYTLDDPRVREVALSFVFERGDWYLDGPTY